MNPAQWQAPGAGGGDGSGFSRPPPFLVLATAGHTTCWRLVARGDYLRLF
jgi:hypothetical protein